MHSMNPISRVFALSVPGLFFALCACGAPATSPVSSPLVRASLPVSGPRTVRDATTFKCRTLDDSQDPTDSYLNGISNKGGIAGGGYPGGGYIVPPPYRQRDYRSMDYPGAVDTSVAAINDRGVVAGSYRNSAGDIFAFIEIHGVWVSLKRRGSIVELLGLNDEGSIVGFYTNSQGINHGFELDGKYHHIDPPGAVSFIASGINDGQDIVGDMTTSRGTTESFLLKRGAYTELSYPGAETTQAFGINPQDHIVGSYVDASGATHGFLLSDPVKNPQWRSFDEPHAVSTTRISGINDSDHIVGSYADGRGDTHGFLCAV